MLCTILIEILFNDVLLQNMYVTRYDSLSRLDMSNTSTTANGRVYHGMEPAESEDIFQQSYNSPSGLETAYCQAPPRNPMLFPPPKICWTNDLNRVIVSWLKLVVNFKVLNNLGK